MPTTLSCSVTHCNTLQHTATHCNTLQHTLVLCQRLCRLCLAVLASVLQCVAVCCSVCCTYHGTTRDICEWLCRTCIFDIRVLQCVAVCCSVLQCVAVVPYYAEDIYAKDVGNLRGMPTSFEHVGRHMCDANVFWTTYIGVTHVQNMCHKGRLDMPTFEDCDANVGGSKDVGVTDAASHMFMSWHMRRHTCSGLGISNLPLSHMFKRPWQISCSVMCDTQIAL